MWRRGPLLVLAAGNFATDCVDLERARCEICSMLISSEPPGACFCVDYGIERTFAIVESKEDKPKITHPSRTKPDGKLAGRGDACIFSHLSLGLGIEGIIIYIYIYPSILCTVHVHYRKCLH